jgi:hypothetical protein
MPAFAFKSILLNTLPGNAGWIIYGVKHYRSHQRHALAVLDPLIGQVLAEQWANSLAKALAGKPHAEQD